MINLDELEKLANAATPGPWATALFTDDQSLMHYEEWGVHYPGHPDARQHGNGEWHAIHICRGMTGPNRTNNAIFIAAANPQAILELIADYKRLQFDVVNLLFRDKLAARIIEPLAREGNPHAQFWMARFGRKIAIDEPSNYDEAIRTINNLSIELARLRTELAAKSPPPAVPSYHRLDFSERRPCFRCTQPMDDIYLTAFGQEDLCKECAEELGAELFVPDE